MTTEAEATMEARAAVVSPGEALLRSPVTLVLVVLALLALHVGFGHADFPLIAHLGAASMGFLAFVAVRGARRARLPFVAYFAAYFYVVYGLSTLSEQRLATVNGPVYLSEEARTLAVWACTLVLGIALLAARLARPLGHVAGEYVRLLIPAGDICRQRGAVRAWALFVLLVQGVRVITSIDPSAAWNFALGLVATPVLAQALLFAEWRASNAASSRTWFWGYTLATVVLGLASGALGGAFAPLVGVFILQWLAAGRIRVAPVFVLVGLALLFNPAKMEYRKRVWTATEQVSFEERATIWVEALQNTWGGERSEFEGNLKGTRQRFAEIAFVAQVFDWVPRYVPHSGFLRWKMIAYSYVPRALWSGKPLLTRFFNAEYALAFGLQSAEGAETTAINIPLVTEAYWTFGWLGIALASALVGLLLGAYEGAFFPEHWGMQVLGMTFLLSLPTVGHLGTFYMGIAQRLGMGVGVLWLIAGLSWMLAANRRTA